MEAERIITAVQKRPDLYDKTSDNYSNRNFVIKQWKEIGVELGMDDASAKKKWTALRDYFQKVHKQLTTTASGSAGGIKRKWYLYDSIKFLLPHIIDRKTCSNLSDASDEEEQLSEGSFSTHESLAVATEIDESSQPSRPTVTISQANSSQASTSQASTSQASTSQASTSQASTSQTRKRKRFPQERQEHSLDSDILSAIQSIKPNEETKDEDQLFLQSLAPKLKMLDPLSKLEFQAEMQMLLLRYLRRGQAATTETDISTPNYQPQQPHYDDQYQTYHQQI